MLILLKIFIFSTFGSSLPELPKAKMALSNGTMIEVLLATRDASQQRGLSGVRKGDLGQYQGMLFVYPAPGPRSFWMPDTYFNLDIIFLDGNFKVTDIHKNVKAHPGYNEPPKITRLPLIYSHHVLEINADSPVSKMINKGTQLKWMDKKPFTEILQGIHQPK